ncbi:AbaSI family restriction endonuclease [Microbacterium sp. NPDC087589]|uniref:AbaSI family restriction endonuclease n=1 Tax=Microbacterium sp. NPDC087589 TaxID=3364191 RepID=UPI0038257F7F
MARNRWTPPSDVDFYSRMLRSISGKRYEVYAISRILHLLDDPDIEIITQQPVRLDDGALALLDLYLPQFRVGIEVDELHHFSEGSMEADKIREQAIMNVSRGDIRRVRVEDAESLTTLKQQVDELIADIRKMKSEALSAGTFTPFVYGNRHNPEHWRSVGTITTDDDIQMHSMVDVCALFGKDVAHWQRGVLPLSVALQVWMPTLAQEGMSARSDWKNTLSRDELTIVEEQVVDGQYVYDPNRRSVVFAKFKDPVFLTQYYRFLGVFEISDIESAGKKRVTYTRVAAEVNLAAHG